MSDLRLCSIECRVCRTTVAGPSALGDPEAFTFIEAHRDHDALYGTVRKSAVYNSEEYVSAALSPIDTLADRIKEALFPEPLRAYEALIKRCSRATPAP